jgi:RNA polymerase sigma factor (sigma-70 family)
MRRRPGVTLALQLSGNRIRRLDDERLAALVQRGDGAAFEALYDRHHAPLLAFCRHMAGNREDGEDALQQTFLRAHRALTAGRVPDKVRPWLFAIARNRCRTLLAARRDAAVPVDELEPALDGLADDVGRRADLRELVADLARLPEEQRGALVLFELGDLSHREIATVIGCPPDKVKALVFQARTALIAEREAREVPCTTIREQLETARAGVLRRAPLRRHLRQCAPCTAYRVAVVQQRAGLAILLPVAPTAGLKIAVLAGTGGGAAAAAGGGAAVVVAKLAVTVAVAGSGVTGGVATVEAVTKHDAAKNATSATVARAPASAPAPAPRAVAAPEPRVPVARPRREKVRRVADTPPGEASETAVPRLARERPRTVRRVRLRRAARRLGVSPRRLRRRIVRDRTTVRVRRRRRVEATPPPPPAEQTEAATEASEPQRPRRRRRPPPPPPEPAPAPAPEPTQAPTPEPTPVPTPEPTPEPTPTATPAP